MLVTDKKVKCFGTKNPHWTKNLEFLPVLAVIFVDFLVLRERNSCLFHCYKKLHFFIEKCNYEINVNLIKNL